MRWSIQRGAKVSPRRLAELIGFTIVVAGLPFEPHVAHAQFPPAPFPVLQIDSAVRARLVEEWEPDNRFQHERGYCVRFVTDTIAGSFFQPAVVAYTLVEIVRGGETGTTQHGIRAIECPPRPDVTTLHVHPPYFCTRQDDGASCSAWSLLAHQCFPSPTDAFALVRSNRPFDLIQCGRWEIMPYFRIWLTRT